MKLMFRFPLLVSFAVSFLVGFATHPSTGKVVHLLNHKDLNGFYSYLRDFGPGNDPDHVFTLTNGLLHISGQHYGYLATRETNFANYKLVAEFKWGQKTWSPRENNARDSG